MEHHRCDDYRRSHHRHPGADAAEPSVAIKRAGAVAESDSCAGRGVQHVHCTSYITLIHNISNEYIYIYIHMYYKYVSLSLSLLCTIIYIVCVYTHVYIYMYICTCVCVYIYVHTHRAPYNTYRNDRDGNPSEGCAVMHCQLYADPCVVRPCIVSGCIVPCPERERERARCR